VVVQDHGRLHPHHREPPGAELMTGRRRTIALVVLCVCALVAGVDMTIVNVALPFIGRALDAPTNELQWTVDAYNIVIAGLLVLGGGLADRYGRKRVFLVSLALFGVGCLFAASSTAAEQLIASRALMGVGAAGFTAPALAIIASMYPTDERAGAIGAFVVFGASGLAIGPIAGGLLLDHYWWGSVFLVDVPIVAVGVIVGAFTIPESRAPVPEGERRPPLDVIGALLSVIGLTGVLFGIIEGPNRGWTSPAVVGGLTLGALAIATFVRRELRIRFPLFDVRILARRVVLTGSITLFIAYVLFNAFLFLNPQYLQDVKGESIVTVGLLLVPFAVVFGLCSKQAPAVLERLGGRVTITLGLAVTALASTMFAIAIGRSVSTTVVASVVLGAGLSLLIAPPSTIVMNDLPESKAGDGSSLNFVSRFIGAAVGIAVVGSVLASIYASDVSNATASLDAAQADKAQGSIQGALEVSQTLATSAEKSLAAAARDAFDRGATAAYLVTAVLGALAALWAWFALHSDSAARVLADAEAEDPESIPHPETLRDATPRRDS
jgi:DHA2 family multidrug resistance protein-like MFS transporter